MIVCEIGAPDQEEICRLANQFMLFDLNLRHRQESIQQAIDIFPSDTESSRHDPGKLRYCSHCDPSLLLSRD